MALGGTHLSAKELAGLRLPGLPTSERRVLARAMSEGWSYVDRLGRGGGRRYAIADLPEEARKAFTERRAKIVPANTRSPGRPKGTDFFTAHPAVADAVEVILSHQQLAAPRVLELLAQKFAELPSRRTLARFILKLEQQKKALLASTRDPDAYKNRYRVSLGRADGSVTRAHEVWELDTTAADVLTKGGRKMIFGVIDRYSRRTRFMVGPAESGQAVRRLLVDTIRAWGVMPEAVMTDNGSGYINKSIVTALETLGIEHRICPPGSPEKKPHVERVFGTFTRQRAELLQGYAGHSVADAQKLRGRQKKITGRAEIVAELEPEDLQQVLDGWLDGVYHVSVHSSLRMTPMQRWLSSPTPARAAPSEDVLKIALSAFVSHATVGKRGVQWKGGRYWAPALAAFMGQQVQVRRDEDDLGALFIFDADGHFIDVAVNHERAGLSEQEFAEAARRQQAAVMNQQRAELRDKKRAFSMEEARDALLRSDAEAAGKLRHLPLPTTKEWTPQVESIAAAPEPTMPSAAEIERAFAQTAPVAAAPAIPISDRVRDADRVLAAADRGEQVDPTELQRATLFASSNAYRAEKLLTGAFGSAPITQDNEQRRTA